MLSERVVYFMDAAHFVQGSFLGHVWSHERIFVSSSSGRKRFNVLGAINAITHELVTFTNCDYINSSSVCELLTNIRAINFNKNVSIVLDNAKYQRCALVQNKAAELDIELLFLPPYSPNLNLIERFWKFTKKHALNSKYYATFEGFKAAIVNVVDGAHTVFRKELDSLLTLKFQTFSKSAAPGT